MPTTSRPKLDDLSCLTRCLSLEEAHTLADQARRKSTDKIVREDLRLKLGHTNVLDSALKDIAARSPPPSPTQSVCSPYGRSKPKDKQQQTQRHTSITWATQTVSYQYESLYDDAGFEYGDDGEEDLAGLQLVRTQSRKPQR